MGAQRAFCFPQLGFLNTSTYIIINGYLFVGGSSSCSSLAPIQSSQQCESFRQNGSQIQEDKYWKYSLLVYIYI